MAYQTPAGAIRCWTATWLRRLKSAARNCWVLVAGACGHGGGDDRLVHARRSQLDGRHGCAGAELAGPDRGVYRGAAVHDRGLGRLGSGHRAGGLGRAVCAAPGAGACHRAADLCADLGGVAVFYARTLTPDAAWASTHSFGLGGLFGDTVMGAILSVLPIGSVLRAQADVAAFGRC